MSRIKNKHTKAIAMFSAVLLLTGAIAGCNKSQTTDALVSEALQYLQKGDTKAAVIQLKNVLQKNADNAEARYLLGTIYNQTGDPQSAEKEIRKALSLGMSPATVQSDLAKALLMQGQYQKVLDETTPSAAVKADAEILALRANAFMALGKIQEAKDSFELALLEKPDFPSALIGLANIARSQQDLDGANRLVEQAVSKNPNNIDALMYKADLLRAQGKVELALEVYDQILTLKPDNSQAHINKAYLEIGMKKFDAANADIDAVRKSSPNALIVSYAQALLDYSQGKHAAALESLQQVLRVAPEHMPSLLLSGAVQFSLGSTQQAEQNLKKYLDKNPQSLYARQLLTATLLKNGQTQRAIDLLTPVLNDDARQDPKLFALAGEAYMQAKNFTKATEYFEKASALAPQTAAFHTSLGLSKLGQGDNAQAVAELEIASNLDVKSPQAGILLVMTHMRLKEYDKALAAVKVLEKEHAENPIILNLKGSVFVALKNMSSARTSFEKALSLQPTFFSAAANLAQLDLQDKKPDAAKKHFETLLEKDKKNIQAMTALATLALSEGKKQEATTWLERASNENPDAVQPAMQLASHYLRSGEKQKALNLARKFQVSAPGNPIVLDMLAQAQFANDDKNGALESYSKLAAAVPTSALAQLRIASIQMSLKNPAAASEALKKALSLQPDFIDAQLAQAELEVGKGNLEQALTIARQIQKQHEKSAVGYLLEGELLMAQKKFGLAVKSYEKALAFNKNGPLMIKLHVALKHAGQGKEADTRLGQWIKETPNDLSLRMHLADTYLEEKQNKAAIAQYKSILNQNPKNAVVLNNLALAYQQDKDPRALEYAEKAYQLAGESPAILDTLGWLLVEQGNTSRGLPMLQKAVSLAADATEIRYHLAVGLFKSGDKVKARKEAEQLLASGKSFSKMDETKALLKQL